MKYENNAEHIVIFRPLLKPSQAQTNRGFR